MVRAKLKFRLHRAVIVLICLALLVALMQGPHGSARTARSSAIRSWKNWPARSPSRSRSTLAPLMRSETPDEKRISQLLDQLTHKSRILDAGVYDEQGDTVARSGESVEVRDRLALDGKKPAATSTSKSSNLFRVKRPARLPAPDAGYPYRHRSAAGR